MASTSFGPSSFMLSDYLEKLPGATFRKLYQQPSTAFAIFRRMLPNLAKIYVQALLYMPEPLSVKDLDIWVRPEGKTSSNRAIGILRSLHIVQVVQPSKDKPQEIQLTTNFKKSLRLALEGSGSHSSFGVPSSLPVNPDIDLAFLDSWAGKIWQDILYYVVNSVPIRDGGSGGGYGSQGGPRAAVRELLMMGGLVQRRESGAVQISEHGFNFLLQEANAQVWTLLLLWLEAADRSKAAAKGGAPTSPHQLDNVEMLSFLFMLASLELGRAYDTSALTDTRRNMLPALADFGLIYIDPRNREQYFPTRLATTLTSSSSALRSVAASLDAATAKNPGDAASLANKPPSAAAADQNGGIIIETNYRIYAYTSSPLQIAILHLFARLNMRWPNMVSGRLTRESVREAIKDGISANQIINYLTAHAHPQLLRAAAANGSPVLPPTVVDQIRLWQLESERMKHNAGFLFKDFDSLDEYTDMAVYAQEIGVLVWRNDRKRIFFVSKVEQLRDWLKARKKGG